MTNTLHRHLYTTLIREARTTLSASVVSSLRDARQFLDSCLLTVHSRVQVRTNETFTDLSQITAIRVADVPQVSTDSSDIGYSVGNMEDVSDDQTFKV